MRILLEQCRYEQRAFWRSPISVVTSVGLTPVFLLLLAGITGTNAGTLTRYLPGIITMSAMSTCVTSIAVNLSYRRDTNILKRLYATPVPPWMILLAVVLSSAITTAVVAVASLAFVRLALGVDVTVDVPRFLAVIALVSLTLSWLGCALSAVPSQSVVATANLVVFPALFMGGSMFPLDEHVWYAGIGRLLPPHFARQLLGDTLGVHLGGAGLLASVAGLLVWAAAAGTLGLLTFRWVSRGIR